MAKSFSKFPHKTLRFILIIAVIIIIIIIIIDVGGNIFLREFIDRARGELKESAGFDLDIGNYFFDVFLGIVIYDLRLTKDNTDIFSVDIINLHPDLVNLVVAKSLYFPRINIKHPYIYKVETIDKEFISAILLGLLAQDEAIRSTIFKIQDLNLMDMLTIDIDGYTAFAQTKIFLTRGKIRLKDASFLVPGVAIRNMQHREDINYTFETTFLGDDFLINKLELTGYEASNLFLSGGIKDFSSDVNLDLEGELNSILLEDIKLFNNKYFNTKGFADINFKISGQADSAKFLTKIKFSNCACSILNSFSVKKINSDLSLDGKDLSLELTGSYDDSPINLSVDLNQRNIPHIHSELSIKDLGYFDNVAISFQGYYLNNVIGGDLEAIFNYIEQKTNKTTSIAFKNAYLDFEMKKFKSNALDIVWLSDSPEEECVSKAVSFKGLNTDFAFENDALSINNFIADLYGGTIEGNGELWLELDEFKYRSKLYLQNLKVKDFAKEFLLLGYQLTGMLSGSVGLSSDQKKSIFGEIQIANGQVFDNVVLGAISDFFGMPSLRTIDFDNLRINFLKEWGKYSTVINLFSPDITIYLDNNFLKEGIMNGYLSVRLSSSLMDQSKPFKRLFKYIEYNQPTVYFPFNLKGYVDNPRIEWLQNEFKEKLGAFLKDKYKKILQDQLNRVAKKFVK
ncbi:MAG: hypothetical protein ACTSU2_02390 [Promethearchaeota archaeon]